MNSFHRWTALGAAGAVVLGTAAFVVSTRRAGMAQEAGPGSDEPVSVRVAPVEERLMVRPIVAAGTFGPKDETRLSFKIGGIVERVDAEVGQKVHEGEPLASLDLNEIESQLQKARSAAEKADRDLERARRLYADSVVTLSQLQDAETAAEVARADVSAAAFNRRYAVIVAPASGIILDRSADPGETVAPGAEVLVLGSRERGAVVRVGLTDRDVVRVHIGDKGTARFDATGERVYAGVVTEIAAVATPGTGTYAVEVTLGAPGPLAAGMVGRVEIVPASAERTPVVPVEALLEADGSTAGVFALSADGTRAERKEIAVWYVEGDVVAVASGLEGVSSVVTDGGAWLSDGEAVRVIR